MTEKKKYKYEFAPYPQVKKGVCPQCSRKSLVRFIDTESNELMPEEYGKCERINNCGYHHRPGTEAKPLAYRVEPRPQAAKQLFVEDKSCLELMSSNFHQYCKDHFGIDEEHLRKWGVGTKKDFTVFMYQNGKVWNQRFFRYLENGRSDKNMQSFSMKQPDPSVGEYKMCLFGEHLLDPDKKKIVFVVESEKTAVIASWYYEEYDFLACTSASGLTAEKIDRALTGRRAYWLADADIAGRQASSLRNLQAYKDYNVSVDLFPDREDGYDLADYLHDNPSANTLIPLLNDDDLLQEDSPSYEIPSELQDLDFSGRFFGEIKETIVKNFRFRTNIVLDERLMFRVDEPWKGWRDYNLSEVYVYVKDKHEKIKKDDLKSLLDTEEMRGEDYNPIKEYFELLPEWNGETDYIIKLASYVKAKDQPYFNTMLKKHLVRAVASVFDDEIINRYVFCLIGEKQNQGKSEWVHFLNPLPKQYYKQTTPTVINRDAHKCLSYKFLWSFDDLDEQGDPKIMLKLKPFISEKYISERNHYVNNERTVKRITTFFANSNNNSLLSDSTGNTRWLNFEIEDVNHNYRNYHTKKQEIFINDVWAQAYALFLKGYDMELTTSEKAKQNEINAEMMRENMERDILMKYLEPAKSYETDAECATCAEIMGLLYECLGKESKIRLDEYKMRQELRNCGFDDPSIKRTKKGKVYCFRQIAFKTDTPPQNASGAAGADDAAF